MYITIILRVTIILIMMTILIYIYIHIYSTYIYICDETRQRFCIEWRSASTWGFQNKNHHEILLKVRMLSKNDLNENTCRFIPQEKRNANGKSVAALNRVWGYRYI